MIWQVFTVRFCVVSTQRSQTTSQTSLRRWPSRWSKFKLSYARPVSKFWQTLPWFAWENSCLWTIFTMTLRIPPWTISYWAQSECLKISFIWQTGCQSLHTSKIITFETEALRKRPSVGLKSLPTKNVFLTSPRTISQSSASKLYPRAQEMITWLKVKRFLIWKNKNYKQNRMHLRNREITVRTIHRPWLMAQKLVDKTTTVMQV